MRKALLSVAVVLAVLLRPACCLSAAAQPEAAAALPADSISQTAEEPSSVFAGYPAAPFPGAESMAESSFPAVTTTIADINKYGNIILSIPADDFRAMGYEAGDLINVEIAGRTLEMPIGTEYANVDTGEPICVLVLTDGIRRMNQVILALNMGSLAGSLEIAVESTIAEDPGYLWTFNEGFSPDMPVVISMAEKGGYLEQYRLRSLEYSLNRSDYPDLTDEQYANFRAVKAPGIREGILYRSSSPVDPDIKRNAEADAACRTHGIRTVINLADSPEQMRSYEGYGDSYYSTCDVIPLAMTLDFFSPDFKSAIAKGLRFLTAHEGPYLVHCKEGKDRAGFVSAILECLTGASIEEVIDDYMITYRNYYGIVPGDARYDLITENYICRQLKTAFSVEDLQKADLVKGAEQYLTEAGMTAEEIQALKDSLS